MGTQDHPTVAVIGGGDDSFAIAWSDHGGSNANVVVQRFDGSGNAVAGDSMNTVNTTTGSDQTSPSIGASSTGAFYAVAWIDGSSGHVRARLIDEASGYDFNNVTGQNDDFQVSLADGHMRSNPAVAAGGSGPYLAIGWEDDTSSGAGTYVRRFPLPP
jgi:hypothetical protein